MIPVYGDDALFLSHRCQRICLNAIQKMIKRYSDALFGEYYNLTSSALKLSFRDRIFDQTMNVRVTSDISGDDQDTIYQYYHPIIDEYECHKGEQFMVDGNSL